MQVSLDTFNRRVAARLGTVVPMGREAVRAVVHELADVVAAGDTVTLPTLGQFGTKRVGAKWVTVPNLGTRHHIEAHRVPRFRAAAPLKRRVRAATGSTYHEGTKGTKQGSETDG